jgi:branched-subunit amino acid ABC-type transport system permease component
VFSQFLQLFFAGVAQGCVYALVALGFVLIYKATETVNFAQGDLMMLGAFFGLTASTILGWPYWATILFAIVVMALVGMLIEAHRRSAGARLSDLHGGDDHDRRRLHPARRRRHGAGLGHGDARSRPVRRLV